MNFEKNDAIWFFFVKLFESYLFHQIKDGLFYWCDWDNLNINFILV